MKKSSFFFPILGLVVLLSSLSGCVTEAVLQAEQNLHNTGLYGQPKWTETPTLAGRYASVLAGVGSGLIIMAVDSGGPNSNRLQQGVLAGFLVFGVTELSIGRLGIRRSGTTTRSVSKGQFEQWLARYNQQQGSNYILLYSGEESVLIVDENQAQVFIEEERRNQLTRAKAREESTSEFKQGMLTALQSIISTNERSAEIIQSHAADATYYNECTSYYEGYAYSAGCRSCVPCPGGVSADRIEEITVYEFFCDGMYVGDVEVSYISECGEIYYAANGEGRYSTSSKALESLAGKQCACQD